MRFWVVEILFFYPKILFTFFTWFTMFKYSKLFSNKKGKLCQKIKMKHFICWKIVLIDKLVEIQMIKLILGLQLACFQATLRIVNNLAICEVPTVGK